MNKTHNITLNDLIVQGKENIVSDMDGEKVILSVQNGKYYNLGQMGGAIWDLMMNPVSVTQLVAGLISEYDVDQVKCEQQVISFLDHLLAEDLIQLKEEECT